MESTFLDWVSGISGIVTIIGFGITLYQIRNVKKTATAIQEEVKATQAKIQKVLAISDLSKSSETIKIIYSYLHNGNYELAHSKLMEINDLIIEIKEVPALRGLQDLKKLEAYGKYLAKDIKGMQDTIIVEHSEVDKNTIKVILENLRMISDIFAKINAQLKHNNDE